MRVVCPFTPERLKDATVDALQRYAPGFELVAVRDIDDEFGYGKSLADWWSNSDHEDLVIVEHDIVIHEHVIPMFERCGHPWCTFSYRCEPGFPQIVGGLGCVRFSADILAAEADLAQFFAMTAWSKLDGAVHAALIERGYVGQHMHWPLVGHIHSVEMRDEHIMAKPAIVHTETVRDDSPPDLGDRWILEAQYESGYTHREDDRDMSPYQPGQSHMFDILQNLPDLRGNQGRMVRYSLIGPKERYDVDWRDLPADAKPVYHRRIHRDVGADVNPARAWRTMAPPRVKYIFGFEFSDPETGEHRSFVKEIIN